MTDFTRSTELSGLEAEEFSDMEEIIQLISQITETDYPPYRTDAVGIDFLRDDVAEEPYKKDEILKNSKTGFEIPKIM